MKRSIANRILTLSLCGLTVVAADQSMAQSVARRGIGSAAGTLSDMANRQIELENEIALARARAGIDFENYKRARALRYPPPPEPRTKSSAEIEFTILDRSYPAWFEHAESAAFTNWLKTQPAELRNRFSSAQTAEELMAVINEHRLSLGMEPKRLAR